VSFYLVSLCQCHEVGGNTNPQPNGNLTNLMVSLSIFACVSNFSNMKRAGGAYSYEPISKRRRPRQEAVVVPVARMARFPVVPRGAVPVYRKARVPALRPSLNNGLLKCVDFNLNTGTSYIESNISTNTTSECCSIIGPGNGVFQREGRILRYHSIEIMWTPVLMQLMVANQTLSPLVRMVVVWDKNPAGAIPTFNTVFGNTDNQGAETCAVMDPLRLDNMSRFTILSDTIIEPTHQISPVATGVNGSVIPYKRRVWIDLRGKYTSYSAQTTPPTMGDIATGGLIIFWRANYAGGATAPAGFGGWQNTNESIARVKFYDN